ncbi:MAG: CoA-binding protein [Candidatus Helarchaeota archaeon]
MVTDRLDTKMNLSDQGSNISEHPFNRLFSPRNITIVGASKNPNFGSGFFISALTKSQYPPEQIYLINPKHAGTKIKDLPIHASLEDLPDDLDLVISAIRAKYVPDLLRTCVKKRVKFVLVFTSGFSETLSDKGRTLEKELLDIIKGTSTRIIGPNCLGPLDPEARVSYNPKALMKVGNISFASQSGGHASTLVQIQENRMLYYRRGLSFGNQIDINCLEILNYYAQDPLTKVIGFYLESLGKAHGRDFIIRLREVTKKKPVIIWKGGQTRQGMRATQSHTGALAGSLQVWQSAIQQAGGIFVRTSSEFWDCLHLFSHVDRTRFPKGNRIGILVPGGGNSVEMADTFSNYGIDIPVLTEKSQAEIGEIFPDVNTSFRNPIDTGASGVLAELLFRTMKILDADPNIDMIGLYLPVSWISQLERMGVKNFVSSVARSFGRINKKISKFFFMINPVLEISEFDTRVGQEFKKVLHKKNLPFFDTTMNAAIACRHLVDYQDYLTKNCS